MPDTYSCGECGFTSPVENILERHIVKTQHTVDGIKDPERRIEWNKEMNRCVCRGREEHSHFITGKKDYRVHRPQKWNDSRGEWEDLVAGL